MITRGEQVHNGQKSAAAAVEGERVLGVLEAGEVALECETSGVAAASVVEANGLARIGLRKGSREVDGWGDTAELRVGLVSTVDGLG